RPPRSGSSGRRVWRSTWASSRGGAGTWWSRRPPRGRPSSTAGYATTCSSWPGSAPGCCSSAASRPKRPTPSSARLLLLAHPPLELGEAGVVVHLRPLDLGPGVHLELGVLPLQVVHRAPPGGGLLPARAGHPVQLFEEVVR